MIWNLDPFLFFSFFMERNLDPMLLDLVLNYLRGMLVIYFKMVVKLVFGCWRGTGCSLWLSHHFLDPFPTISQNKNLGFDVIVLNYCGVVLQLIGNGHWTLFRFSWKIQALRWAGVAGVSGQVCDQIPWIP